MTGQLYSLTYGEPTTPGPLRHIEDQYVFSMMDRVEQASPHTRTESRPDPHRYTVNPDKLEEKGEQVFFD